ncbi:heterokaryon incompatibility protein-domain-containing protein [Biscogniauxia sp. FL1348]|nr:heterokaryon incompatibility protein-domain-containing protein [Biscogniauxia sp. FL1348]
MRLINCRTHEFEEFVRDVPEYAILSHTWYNEEVTFQDMQRGGSNKAAVRGKKGYEKVEALCRIALEHDFDYAWIDTCCIDKSSSAELTEAINSMFAWYKRSAICYAFLSDFKPDPALVLTEVAAWFEERERSEKHVGPYNDPRPLNGREVEMLDSIKRNLGKCRWFTRGWTLQELIAPTRVIFYDSRWNCFGTKAQLAPILSWITRIDSNVLKGGSLEEVLVGRRMSWASSRETTRVEDMAYCLLGIFDINMPLLYGEGEKAFTRLQEEIIQSSNDLSIFAWEADRDDRRRFRGLYASSPAEFKGCRNIVNPSFEWNNGGEYSLTSRGLRTKGLVRIGGGASVDSGSYFLSLNCVDARHTKHVLAISLRKYGPSLFARTKPRRTQTVFDLNMYSALKLPDPQYICCRDSATLDKRVMNSRRNAIKIQYSDEVFDPATLAVSPPGDWDARNSILLSFQRQYFWGIWKIRAKEKNDGIGIVCVRSSSSWLRYGVFAWDDIPVALLRDDLLPSHVEDILQRLHARTSTKCAGFTHTVQDLQDDLSEDDIEVPGTLLRINSQKTRQVLSSRRKFSKRMHDSFKLCKKVCSLTHDAK